MRTEAIVAIIVLGAATLALGIVLLVRAEPWVPLEEKLHAAVLAHDVARVRDLLARGARPDGPEGWEHPPLAWAARMGWVDVVQLLLERGADPNLATRSMYAESPLHGAVQEGRWEVVRLLLDRGAIATGTDKAKQKTLLHLAAARAEPPPADLLERLVEAGKGALSAKDSDGLSPLAYAVDHDPSVGFEPTIRAFLRAGAPAADWDALTRAVPDPLAILLEAGASPDTASPDGAETLLLKALRAGHDAKAQVLLAHGADANLAAKDGEPPLVAALRGRSAQSIPVLLAKGARPDGAGAFHPLAAAVESGLPEAVSQLLAAGARPELCPDLLIEVQRRSGAAPSGAEAQPASLPPDELAARLVAMAKEQEPKAKASLEFERGRPAREEAARVNREIDERQERLRAFEEKRRAEEREAAEKKRAKEQWRER